MKNDDNHADEPPQEPTPTAPPQIPILEIVQIPTFIWDVESAPNGDMMLHLTTMNGRQYRFPFDRDSRLKLGRQISGPSIIMPGMN